jgi:transposase-like protein
MPPHADVLKWEHLPFPRSLVQFQRLFPDDEACARYLEGAKWPRGFECPHCGTKGEPFRFEARPHVLRCKSCKRDVSLKAGSVLEGSHTPLTIWFWGAYLMSSLTPGMSALQFQRQVGLTRYETAYQIFQKLRAGMVRPDRDKIGGNLARKDHVEVDETWIGGSTRGEGRGVHDQTLVIGAVEVRQRPPKKGDKPERKGGRYAGRLRLEALPDRTAKSLCGFVENAVEPGAIIITDAAPSYHGLEKLGYAHLPVVEANDPKIAEEYLPIIHLAFSNLKSWLRGTHHGVSAKHLQAYLNEYTFRFNRRFDPFNAFRSLLGIGANGEAPTYDGLYSGEWKHPNVSGHG